MADNPNNFAYVPDKKLPSTWKLDISDATHIAGAITALTTGFRGNKVEIPAKDKPAVISKIRGAINKLSDKDQKANLLERLSTVKSAEKAFMGKLEPEDVNYIPLSTTKGEACANCRWFRPDMDSHYACFIVDASDADDEPILATGICDRWEGAPEQPEDPMEVMVETLVEALQENADVVSEAVYSSVPMPMMDMGKALEQPGIMERIWNGLKAIASTPELQSDLLVLKGANGKNYWLASFTNNFKDREDEILSEHAHKEFEMRLDMKLTPMPELWAWHTDNTRHGKALSVWYQDHNMFAIGEFDDTPEATKAINYYRKHPVKLSHGFIAPKWAFKNGVYDAYNTFEISTLPPSVAANPYTSFEEIKAMPVPENREAFIKELFGDKAPDVLAKVNAKSNAAKELGELVEFKDFASANKPVEKEHASEGVSILFSEIVEGQTELIGFVKAQAESLRAKDTQIAALKTEKDTQVSAMEARIKALETLTNTPPQRASQSSQTLTNEKSGLTDKLPKQQDSFYGDLFSPAPSANGATS